MLTCVFRKPVLKNLRFKWQDISLRHSILLYIYIYLYKRAACINYPVFVAAIITVVRPSGFTFTYNVDVKSVHLLALVATLLTA